MKNHSVLLCAISFHEYQKPPSFTEFKTNNLENCLKHALDDAIIIMGSGAFFFVHAGLVNCQDHKNCERFLKRFTPDKAQRKTI